MTTNQLPSEAFPFTSTKTTGPVPALASASRCAPKTRRWDPAGSVGEYGWGGAASTHYWVSPADKLIVITLEQIMPYQWDTEFGVKKLIYDAIEK